ncbi:hypothetical protein F5B20DRAFT_531260 [Whalleya microplaca]|nr:hypothetical protein F5B20DRAFT_531260 [Whalleya microplaca]
MGSSTCYIHTYFCQFVTLAIASTCGQASDFPLYNDRKTTRVQECATHNGVFVTCSKYLKYTVNKDLNPRDLTISIACVRVADVN